MAEYNGRSLGYDIDKDGIDPLTMQIFDDVDVSTSVNKRIDAGMDGNPQMVSFKQFGNNGYWRHILIANALVHPSEMTAGMLVQIPIQRAKQSTNKKVVRTTI